MIELSATKGRIFRITHIDNVEWILAHGLRCRNSSVWDPNYTEIGNPELIGKRDGRTVPIAPGGTLSEYIPFYFTPYSPMLYNIKTGYHGLKSFPMTSIVVIVACVHDLAAAGIRFVMTDRHAYLNTAKFSNSVDGLKRIDWKLLQERDFKRDAKDITKVERYQAEALVHEHLPVKHLTGIVCFGDDQVARVKKESQTAGIDIPVVARPNYYL